MGAVHSLCCRRFTRRQRVGFHWCTQDTLGNVIPKSQGLPDPPNGSKGEDVVLQVCAKGTQYQCAHILLHC